MPTARSKTTVNRAWTRQRRDSARHGKPGTLPARQDELGEIERFLAERGATVIPPVDPPSTTGPAGGGNRRQDGIGPQPMAGWRT